MKFGAGFFSVSLLPFAPPVSPVASGWYSQCWAGLKARPEVGVLFGKGETGSGPHAEHRQHLPGS